MIEGEFEALLGVQPSRSLAGLVADLFRDLWDNALGNAASLKRALKTDLKAIEKNIDSLLDRIVDADSRTIITAYERKTKKLKSKQIELREQLADNHKPKHTYEEMFEHAMMYLSNPHKLWVSPKLADKRTVLKLTFADRLAYKKGRGFRTPAYALLFKALREICEGNFSMARPGGESLNSLFDELADWEHQFEHGGFDLIFDLEEPSL